MQFAAHRVSPLPPCSLGRNRHLASVPPVWWASDSSLHSTAVGITPCMDLNTLETLHCRVQPEKTEAEEAVCSVQEVFIPHPDKSDIEGLFPSANKLLLVEVFYGAIVWGKEENIGGGCFLSHHAVMCCDECFRCFIYCSSDTGWQQEDHNKPPLLILYVTSHVVGRFRCVCNMVGLARSSR